MRAKSSQLDIQRHGRVLAEATNYFKARAAKPGIIWIWRFMATATLETLESLGCSPSQDLLLANDDAMRVAEEMMSACDSKEQQVCWKILISILNLLRENGHRALRIIKEAVDLARDLPFSERQKLLVMGLRSQQMIQLLQGDSALEITKEVEAESTWDSQPNGLFLEFLQILLQQTADHLPGYLCFIDFLAFKLRSCQAEAKSIVTELLTADDQGEGMVKLFLGKLQLRSPEGLRCLREAMGSFEAAKCREAEAVALQATATAWLVQEMPNPSAAIDAAHKSQVFFEELGDVRGEAIALQTTSNCRFILKDTDGALAAGYKALRLFGECGDQHGKNMVEKLLQSLGQTQQQLQEAMKKAPPKSTAAEQVEVVKSEEQKQREEYLKTIMEEQDPKNFGEKRSASNGDRKILAVSELRDQKLLKQLAACRAKRGSKKPYFVNLMNGRLLTSSTLQAAMEASACAAVVYDVTKLNHMTPLEVVDVAIRLTQALQVIEDTYALDIVMASTQNIASATGIRTPFHSPLWGFSRTANIENPTKEFRVLDVDAGRWKDDLAFITRYLMGAQSTRPTEAIIRNGGLLVSRLVSARMKLQTPYKIDG